VSLIDRSDAAIQLCVGKSTKRGKATPGYLENLGNFDTKIIGVGKTWNGPILPHLRSPKTESTINLLVILVVHQFILVSGTSRISLKYPYYKAFC